MIKTSSDKRNYKKVNNICIKNLNKMNSHGVFLKYRNITTCNSVARLKDQPGPAFTITPNPY
jgi:hypothetical protein